MKYHTLFFRKLGKMSQNLSSAAVVIGAFRVNKNFSKKKIVNLPNSYFKINKMKKVNKQCLLDTPRTVRVSEKTCQVIV